jgi:hypothetical protein
MTQAYFSSSDNVLIEQDINGSEVVAGRKREEAMAMTSGSPMEEVTDLPQKRLIEQVVGEVSLKSTAQPDVGASVVQEGIQQNQARYGFASLGEVVQEEKPVPRKPLLLEVGSTTTGSLPSYVDGVVKDHKPAVQQEGKHVEEGRGVVQEEPGPVDREHVPTTQEANLTTEDNDRLVNGGLAFQEKLVSMIREEAKIASQARSLNQDINPLVAKVDPVIQEKTEPKEDAGSMVQKTTITTHDDRMIDVKPIAQEDVERSIQEAGTILQVVDHIAEDGAPVIQEALKHTNQDGNQQASSVDRRIQLDSGEILGDELQNPEIREHVVQSILEGVTRVISYPGTSQYSSGAGTSACGLASLNCAKVLLAKDHNNTDPFSFIASLISRETVEVRDFLL